MVEVERTDAVKNFNNLSLVFNYSGLIIIPIN